MRILRKTGSRSSARAGDVILRALIREISRRELRILNEGIFDFIKSMLSGFITIAVDSFNMVEAVKPSIEEFPEYKVNTEPAPEDSQGENKGQTDQGGGTPSDKKDSPTPAVVNKKFNPKEDPGDQVYAVLLMMRVVNSRTGINATDLYISDLESNMAKIMKVLPDMKLGKSEKIEKANSLFDEKIKSVPQEKKEEAEKLIKAYEEAMNQAYEESVKSTYSEIVRYVTSEAGTLKAYLVNVEFPNEVGKDWYQRIMNIGKSIQKPKEGDTAKDILLRHLKAVKDLEALKLKDNTEQILASKPLAALLSLESRKGSVEVYVNAARTEVGRYGLTDYKQRLTNFVPKLIQIDKLMGESGKKIQEMIEAKRQQVEQKFKAQGPESTGTPQKAEPNAVLSHYARRGSTLTELGSVSRSARFRPEELTLRSLIGQMIKSSF